MYYTSIILIAFKSDCNSVEDPSRNGGPQRDIGWTEGRVEWLACRTAMQEDSKCRTTANASRQSSALPTQINAYSVGKYVPVPWAFHPPLPVLSSYLHFQRTTLVNAKEIPFHSLFRADKRKKAEIEMGKSEYLSSKKSFG